MKKDNKGFTFVELMVVMAIIAIGITTAMNMYVYLDNANAKKVIQSIRTELNQARAESMSYGGEIRCAVTIKRTGDGKAYFQVYKQPYDSSTGTYGTDFVLAREVLLGMELTKATIKLGDDASGVSMDYSDINKESLWFSYKRSTGGFNTITCTLDDHQKVSDTGESYAILTIQTSSGDKANLKLYFVTGRLELM